MPLVAEDADTKMAIHTFQREEQEEREKEE